MPRKIFSMKPADVCDRIENWIMIKAKLATAKGVVVGMSGGVDSSVTAVLAKRALGENVLGMILPCDSNPEDERKARLIAEKFGIRTQKADLTSAFKEFRKTLPSCSNEKTLGNLKARLRMAALYYFANMSNSLVLGTSNKSEIAIGYFTKYGDSAADLEPIGDLYKTEVVELAKHLGIPYDVIMAAPTAGLWDGQTDEGEIGMKYIELDAILKAAERNKDVEADAAKIAKVSGMIKKSVHKRQMPEVCKI
jgi:NAD+ synthase